MSQLRASKLIDVLKGDIVPNLFDEIKAGSSCLINAVHTEICRVLEDGQYESEEDKKRHKNEMIFIIARALGATECGEIPFYDIKNIPVSSKDVTSVSMKSK